MFWRRTQPTQHHVDFSGHFERTAFAVGDYAVANTYNGTVIQQFAAGTAPRPTRRPSPQSRPPRDPVVLLGREAELEFVDATLRSTTSAIVLHGASGVGKTVLLKHVAAEVRAGWRDGVLYANVGAQQLEDVLQWLFTVFWDTGEVVYAPGPLGVGEYLADVRALVVLDDVDLASVDVERLVAGARGCGFALGAPQPRSVGTHCRLGGLDVGAAAGLFARVLGRAVGELQRPDVEAFVARVEGLPGLVVTGAQLVRDGVCAPRELLVEASAVLARRRLLALPVEQRELLGLLAELAPAPVSADRLAGDAEGSLERLRAAGVVERHSPRYTLTGTIDVTVARELPHIGSPELLGHLAAEAERVSAADVPMIVAALAWGQRGGEDEAVLHAARALAPLMMQVGCTGAWETVARFGLTAARHLGRPADEALFLHEQGTRLGCLGERDEAREALTRARDIRRALPDDDAAAVSEHNLRQLFGDAGGDGADGSDRGGGGNGGRRPPGLHVVALLAVVGVTLLVVVVLMTRGGSERAATDRAQPALTAPRIVTHTVKPSMPSKGAIITTPAGGATHESGPGVPKGPKIVITTPADNAMYPSGSAVLADYACTNARSCTGDVQPGEAINGDPGPHEFTVRAAGSDGTSVPPRTVKYTVTSAAPDPLMVEAHVVIVPQLTSAASDYSLAYSCSGGTEPRDCTATLDDEVAKPGARITCGPHAVIVSVTDAVGKMKEGMYTLNGPDCGVRGLR